MSIEVQCAGCGRRYRVADESAGKQVKCKACEAIIAIPAAPVAVGAAKPPPLPPPLPLPASPPKLPPLQYPPVPYPPLPPNLRQPPQSQTAPIARQSVSPRNRTLLIVIALVVFAGFATGAYFSYRAVRRVIAASSSPAAKFSDSELQGKLTGTWSGTQHTANGPVSATMTFRSNGTYDTRVVTGGKLADLGGTWDIQNHLLTLVIKTIRTGDPSAVGRKIPLGYVKEVTDATLVFRTDNGDETYQRGQPTKMAKHPATPPSSPTNSVITDSNPKHPAAPPSSPTNSVVTGSNPNPPATPHPLVSRRQEEPTVSLPPAPASLAEPGPWRDLLATLDAAKSSVSGDWKLDQGTLTGSSAQGVGRLKLAPPEATSFELEITFDRRIGTKEFCVLFPAGQRSAQLSMGGMTGQSSSIEGGPRVRDGVPIVNNTDQVLRLTVKPEGGNASIEVTLDGKPYLTFSGPQSRLRSNHMYATDDSNVISLAIHHQSTVDFKHIRIRTIPAK